MTRVRSILAGLSVIVAFSLGCGSSTGPNGGNGNGNGPPPPPPPDNTLSGGVQPIFNNRCALSGCHAGSTPEEGMDLSQDMSHANIVNVPANQPSPSMDRVEPGDPDLSYLVHKIQGTHADASVGGSGARMPLTGCCLSTDQINTIRTWITEGAQNN